MGNVSHGSTNMFYRCSGLLSICRHGFFICPSISRDIFYDQISNPYKDFVLSHSPRMTPELHRSLMIGYSLFTGALILSPMGLVIILVITAFYYLLGRIGSKTMIWISAFILTTISNSYANLYMVNLSYTRI